MIIIISLFAASSSCYNYPCGARACTETGGGSYECAELSGDMTCGFEAYDTQCDDMIDIFVTGDDIDPIYNTGNGLQTDLLKVIQHWQLRSVLASAERFGMMFGINCSAN